MIPTSLVIQNFMCYRAPGDASPDLRLDLDGLHVVCLSGENGAGKSALLDAITWALWGQARTPDDDLIAQGESEMRVELTFQLGDQHYRVARRRQRGGTTGKRGGTSSGKTFLDLQVHDTTGWRPIAETGVRETQERIGDLLRMSYQTFINASFLLQGRADEFTARTPAERKQVLAEILDLGEYQALELKARERARELDGQLRGLRGKIEQLAESAGKVATWAALVRDAEAHAAQMAAQVAEAEAAQASAEARLRSLEQQAEERKRLRRELDTLRKEQHARSQELASLQTRMHAAEALVAQRSAILIGVADLARARAELVRLDDLREQYDRLSIRQNELRQQFSEARGELRSRLAKHEEQQQQLEARAAQREKIQHELDRLAAQLQELGPLALEQANLIEQRALLEQQSNQINDLRHRHEQLVNRIQMRRDALHATCAQHERSLRLHDQQLAPLATWHANLAAAQAATIQLAQDEALLADLRQQEQEDLDRVSNLRAECSRLKTAADKLKANQKILADAGGACPVCRSELGATGIAHVQAHYSQELEDLRNDYSEAKRQADAGDARLKATRSRASQLEQQIASLRQQAAQVATLEHQIHQASIWQSERSQTEALLKATQAQLAAEEYEPEAREQLALVAAELATMSDPSAERSRIDHRLKELDRQLRERDKAEGLRQARHEELARIEQELAALPALLATISEMRRMLEQNDFAHAIYKEGVEVGASISALGYQAEAHTATREQVRSLEHWTQAEQELRLAEQRLDADRELTRKAEELQQQAALLIAQMETEDTRLDLALRDLPAAQSAATQSNEALRRIRVTLQVSQQDLGEKQAYLKRAQADAEQLEREQANERALSLRQDLFAELGEAFGKKGVQAMLIESAIPQIEDEANRLLGRMTDNQMHLSIEMQRDTKKGDTVETLEIKIADALGTRVYDAFSGGEALRANFAVRIALSRLLARRAGARLETLVIDEGFGALDASGRERMVEAITGVQADFRRIIVITHIDELKERFPAQIEITKTAHGSRWELR
ncbi:SMC domain-containing protein [Oscillochloris trichoides DG-6]|uniref:Nuclease SbcCD subunit C n=1 Tax=Oscillochloris trichoides DG-6 TaxID=765420 RepID=E1IIH8_9CHLR|nr:SMC family ATPase [Oscillochloris trichoides]EFO79053.1 SMC domain-containing protein [Oscillochloris trichoides DG-6]